MNRSDILSTAAEYVTKDRDPRQKWDNPSATKTYYAWRNMRRRCTNPKDDAYHNYGGRGIAVCEAWDESYDAFVSDMGIAPEGMTLDRIDVNRGYEPGNCRWVGWDVQGANKRTARLFQHNGKTQSLTDWARELGLGVDTLARRLNVYKMPVEKALQAGSLVPSWRHGTRAGYESHGCRCDKCRESNNERHRKARARRKARNNG